MIDYWKIPDIENQYMFLLYINLKFAFVDIYIKSTPTYYA